MVNAAAIAKALGGRRSGRAYVACCPAHQDRTPSLSIADGDGGRVLVRCFAGCEQAQVIAALQRRGLWPCRAAALPPPDPIAEAKRRETERRWDADNLARVQRTWRQATALRAGDLAVRYLRGRGLAPPRMGWPPSLRCASMRHPSGGAVAALVVGACRWPERSVSALQCTALTEPGVKAPLDPVRWTLGSLRGAAVRLSRWQPGQELVLTEGTEDGLAVLEALPGAAVWATLGAGNAARVVLPHGAEVVLCLDGDNAGRHAAQTAAHAFREHGHGVRIAHLPDDLDPLNSLLQERGAAAGAQT